VVPIGQFGSPIFKVPRLLDLDACGLEFEVLCGLVVEFQDSSGIDGNFPGISVTIENHDSRAIDVASFLPPCPMMTSFPLVPHFSNSVADGGFRQSSAFAGPLKTSASRIPIKTVIAFRSL
jgi:hypothetical protein